jgi:hypothetical protein
LNGKVISEREERRIVLKYASKLFLKIFLSVVATVIGSYLTNQYIAGRSAADAPASLAGATADPKRLDANAASSEAAKADVTVSEGPSDPANALGPAGAIGSRIVDKTNVDKTNDDKVAPPVDKLAERASVPAPLHRSASRDKRISKTNTIATPEIASLTVAPPERGRATTERFFSTNANSPRDASPPQEIGRDDDVSPPLDLEMTDSHIAGRVLKPVIRTVLLLLEPSSLVGHAHEQQRRTSPDEIPSSSRVLRFQPEVTERSSSKRTRVANDVFSSRRPRDKNAKAMALR